MKYTLEHAPTCLNFHNSTAKIRAIAGPPGSAKSVACAMELGHFLAQRQEPDDNGKRRTRVGVIRSTYRKLKRTTYKTITEWLLPHSGSIPSSPPMEGKISYQHPSGDGTTVEVEYLFLALENEADLQNLDSLEISSIYLNEANELSEDVFIKVVERVGRFPPPKDGVKCTEPSVLIDFNLPGKQHWLYRYFVEKDFAEVEGFTKDDLQLFIQPPAVFCDNYDDVVNKGDEPEYRMNPNAENLANLPEGYYNTQLALNKWPQVQSRLLMKWVAPSTGKVIHDSFNPTIHVAKKPLMVIENETVLVGFDTSGVHPCAIFAQYVPSMQSEAPLRVYYEAYGDGMGLDVFITNVMLPILRKHFFDSQVLVICDPANPRDDRTAATPTSILKNEYNLNAIVAPGNNRMTIRVQAVDAFLTRAYGLQVNPSCEMLIEGLHKKYVYKKLAALSNSEGVDLYEKKAVKNAHSHYVDAFQNICVHLTTTTKTKVKQELSKPTFNRLHKRRVI